MSVYGIDHVDPRRSYFANERILPVFDHSSLHVDEIRSTLALLPFDPYIHVGLSVEKPLLDRPFLLWIDEFQLEYHQRPFPYPLLPFLEEVFRLTSNSWNKVGMTLYISNSAIFFPKQVLVPAPQLRSTLFIADRRA